MKALLIDCECPAVETVPGRPPKTLHDPGTCRRGTVEDIPGGGAQAGVLNQPGDQHEPTRYTAVPYGTCGRTVWVGTCRPDGPQDPDLAELVLSDAARETSGT